ncbi:NifU family protein [Flavobacterium sp.]|uniref:NifU family protein n=1 Tax=Flavobacterium sp. TaxID=239 RepID=UPI0025D3677D|nr:NifU family protein [Flavobacterium sp.]
MTNEELIVNIEKALDEIRPFLNSDGGDISLVSVEDQKHVKVRLQGACTSCSLSVSTMKAGVETTIKKYAPQIETVENVI